MTDIPDEQEVTTTFESLGLCKPLCDACEAVGFKTPTRIQSEAIPLGLQGRDLIGLAETGSGKTAAFVLPILNSLLCSDKIHPLYALVLSPTRELAMQISQQFEALGASINLKCATIVGGIDNMSQAVALAKKPHIVVATPGRIVDHLENTKGFHLRAIKYLVMDEADRLLNMEFEEEINKILQCIPKERNTFLFSATMTSKVAKLQRASLRNPAKVEVSSKYGTVKTLKQTYVFKPAVYKDLYLAHLLIDEELANKSTIIFVNLCKEAQRLAYLLRNLGMSAIPLHGQMTQPKRLGALNKFKDQQRSILIATDVASRGLDIPHVDVVVNYSVPNHSKDYIHRVGRTARAGRAGISVTILSQYDVELFQRIEGLIGLKMPEFPVNEAEAMVLRERVEEAQRHAQRELREFTDSRGGRKRGRGGDDDDDGDALDAAPKRHGSSGGGRGGGGGGGRGGGRGRGSGGGRGGGRGGRGRGR